MRISDWSSDVCSSDLAVPSTTASTSLIDVFLLMAASSFRTIGVALRNITKGRPDAGQTANRARIVPGVDNLPVLRGGERRSEEHTSELQSLMRISYAVFCLKKKKKNTK